MTSIPDLSQLDPEEQIKRNLIAKPDLSPGLNLPAIGPPSQMTQDVAQLNHLQGSPKFMGQQSGIASLQPKSTLGKIGKGILGGLDTLGSIATPGLMLRIPGTSMHHKGLEAQAEGKVAGDVAEEQKQQQVNNETANAETERERAQETARHNKVQEDTPDASKWTVVQGVVGPNGQVLQENQTTGELRWGAGITGAGPLKPPEPKPGSPEEQAFDAYIKQGMTPQQAFAKVREKPANPDEGTWQVMEDDNGKPILFNSKTGEKKAAPQGVEVKGTHAKAEQSYEKNVEPVKAAINFADSYLNSGAYTGSGDDTLMLQYFELAKPSTGFRLTTAEIQRQNQARSWRQSLEAKVRHATTGVWFSDEQRKQIVDSMHQMAEAKANAHQGGGEGRDFGAAPAGKVEGSTGTAPDGTKVVIRNGRIVAAQ